MEPIRYGFLLIALLAGALVSCGGSFEPVGRVSRSAERQPVYRHGFQEAAAYSAERGGVSFLVIQNGRTVFEDYPGSGGGTAHKLASGTKSFWGVAAAVAVADGLLTWDERVADTLTEWRSDPEKSRVTVRQLLNFTSGLAPAKRQLRSASDVYDIPLNAPPGEQFIYGPSHLTVFGVFLSSKLRTAGQDPDPLRYLERRVFRPIGLRVADWTRNPSGDPSMAAGASLSAREWAKFGQLILDDGRWNGRTVVRADLLDDLFRGSEANPAYGLTFWLNRAPGLGPTGAGADGRQEPVGGRRRAENGEGERRPGILRRLRGERQGERRREAPPTARSEGASGYIYERGPRDLVMAAGTGNQRLYIIPSQRMVIVRQAEKGGRRGGHYSDAEFLSLILR